MTQLDRRHRTLGRNEPGDPGERIALRVIPQTKIMGRDPRARRHMHGFGADDPCTPRCPGTKMREMPVIRHPILRGILAHGRQHDPVAGRDRAEADRTEKMRVRISAQDAAGVFAGHAGISRLG